MVHKVTPSHTHIAIVGAGPVGSWLALSLAKAGYQVVLLEAAKLAEPLADKRTLALSYSSLEQFKQIGINKLDATPIRKIQVLQEKAWGRTILSTHDISLTDLGAVVAYQDLMQHLHHQLKKSISSSLTVLDSSPVQSIETVANTAKIVFKEQQKTKILTADLAVLSEGGLSSQITPSLPKHLHDYQEVALAAEVSLSNPSSSTAYEYFSAKGPFALLPYALQYRLLWVRAQEEAALLYQNPPQLAQELQAILGKHLGHILQVKPRQLFPLMLKESIHITKGKIVSIGAAAQTLHPIAGQGLNLGLRDANDLLEALGQNLMPQQIDQALLTYQNARRQDRLNTLLLTHGLAKWLRGHKYPWLTGLGMNCLDASAFLRHQFLSYMIFGISHSQKRLGHRIRKPSVDKG